MEDINNYIKENDTDNVILNKLKELGTKLTGQENVQGETVADVLDFINTNYSGGGSSGGATNISIGVLPKTIVTVVNSSSPVSELTALL